MEILALLIGIPLGILASLVAWWILFHYLKPEISFSPKISKLPDERSDSPFRYRIKIRNSGKRKIIDLQIQCRYIVSNMYPELPATDSIVKLYISSDSIPYIGAGAKDKIERIYPEKVKIFEKNHFPEDVRKKAKDNTLTLEDILEIEGSYIEFLVFAFDEYSGSRKLFISHKYNAENIATGPFVKGSLEVVESV
ncbi:MAG: hypothetical protein AB2717_05475 [Candidatus Thiodiazotropha sp.]